MQQQREAHSLELARQLPPGPTIKSRSSRNGSVDLKLAEAEAAPPFCESIGNGPTKGSVPEDHKLDMAEGLASSNSCSTPGTEPSAETSADTAETSVEPAETAADMAENSVDTAETPEDMAADASGELLGAREPSEEPLGDPFAEAHDGDVHLEPSEDGLEAESGDQDEPRDATSSNQEATAPGPLAHTGPPPPADAVPLVARYSEPKQYVYPVSVSLVVKKLSPDDRKSMVYAEQILKSTFRINTRELREFYDKHEIFALWYKDRMTSATILSTHPTISVVNVVFFATLGYLSNLHFGTVLDNFIKFYAIHRGCSTGAPICLSSAALPKGLSILCVPCHLIWSGVGEKMKMLGGGAYGAPFAPPPPLGHSLRH